MTYSIPEWLFTLIAIGIPSLGLAGVWLFCPSDASPTGDFLPPPVRTADQIAASRRRVVALKRP